MNKKTLTATAISALVLSSFSTFAAESNFYGRLDIALTHSDNGTTTQNKKSGSVLENNFSRLGVAGSEQIKSNIELLYRVEVQVNSATDDDDVFKPRNTYLGIKSTLGTVLVGRNDTVMKTSKGTAEAFALTNAAYNRMIAGQVRKADGITYYSPKVADIFTLNATYLMDDNYEGVKEQQYAFSIIMGDKKLKKSPYYLAAVYNTIAGVDAYRGVAQVKFGDVKLSGLYQNTKSQSFSDKQGDSFFVSAIYNVSGVSLKAEYGKDKAGFGKYLKNSISDSTHYAQATDVDIDSFTVGADYRLSKSTKVYAHYAMYSGEYQIANSGSIIELEDDNVVSVSVRYDF